MLIAGWRWGPAHAASADDLLGRLDWTQAERAAASEREGLLAAANRGGVDSLALAAANVRLVLARDACGGWWKPGTRELAEQAVGIRERHLGLEHIEVAAALHALGRVRWRWADFSAARAALQRAHELQQAALGPDDARLAPTLEALGQLLMDEEQHEAARAMLDRALGLHERALGRDHPLVARTLRALGDWHIAVAAYDSAQLALDRALAIQRERLGPDHLETAATQRCLVQLLDGRGDSMGARALAEQVLAARERQLGSDNPQVGQSLDDLAGMEYALGDYAAARVLWERALAIYERTIGDGHPDLATILTNLAHLDEQRGEYSAAHARYERALQVYESALGPGHSILAIILSSMGRLLREMGDLEGARPLYERALRIREQALGPDHPAVANSLAHMAALWQDLGDWRAARPLLERALLIYEATAGPDHPNAASMVNSLALTCEKSGDYDQALRLYERAMAVYERRLGAGHPWLSSLQINLAEVLRETSNPERAFVLLQQALASRRAVLGEEHPDVAEVHQRLALVHDAVGDSPAALREALEAERIARHHLRVTVATLPERQALRYAAQARFGLDQALSLVATTAATRTGRGSHQDDVWRVWNAVVLERALVLDEMAGRRRAEWARSVASAAPLGGERTGEAELSEAYRDATQDLASMLVQQIGTGDASARRAQLDQAHERQERAERALAQASAAFRMRRARTQIELASVEAALPRGSALVAYVRYNRISVPHGQPGPETATPAYLAFALASAGAAPRCVALGDAERIDALVGRWRDEAARGPFLPRRTPEQAQGAYDTAARALAAAIWDPVARAVGRPDRVFVVLDGQLHLVNLAALPGRDGRYLLEQGPLLHVLNAERDLVQEAETSGGPPADTPAGGASPTAVGLLVLGGAEFDALAPDPEVTGAEVALFRGAVSACASLRDVTFPPLPGSLAEVEEVAALWTSTAASATNARPVVRLTGAAATEDAVKRLASGHRVLHLATHGFFLSEDCSAAAPGTRGVGTLVAASSAPHPVQSGAGITPAHERNPLLLSGLALAGANRHASTSPGHEDGILTAEEIAALDLRGVEWAVLSACDTGVGRVAVGEGVFGLRRSLQIAGVRTVVLSLWSIEDQSAHGFMQQLYRARLQQGLDTPQAMHAASLAMLRARRAAGASTHPFYWGGFIAAGGWH